MTECARSTQQDVFLSATILANPCLFSLRVFYSIIYSTMGRKSAPADRNLKHRLFTRVNDQKYNELQAILAKNPSLDMSRLIRSILLNRQVKVFTRDMTLDNLMEELAKLRGEVRAIGININQITKKFHTFPERQRKEFFAKIAFQEHLQLQGKIDRLLEIVSKLSKKWLSE